MGPPLSTSSRCFPGQRTRSDPPNGEKPALPLNPGVRIRGLWDGSPDARDRNPLRASGTNAPTASVEVVG